MDTIALYKKNISQLKKDIIDINEEKIQDYGLLGTYKVISANLSQFLPTVKTEDHLDLIKKIHVNRSQAIIDQESLFLLNNLTIIDNGNILNSCRDNNYIFSTYHTGSYRLLIALFAKLNIRFCLVTEQNFISTQGETVKDLFRNVKSEIYHEDDTTELEILDAENPNLILKIARKLRDNFSIVFYIDGNTGTNDFSIAKEKLLKIKFLSGFIMARKGIGFLSHFTKTPIISVIGKRTGDITNELSLEMIEHDNFSDDRNEYVQFATKKLFSILGNFILLYPEQWEGWFYIQKFIERKDNTVEKYLPNIASFSVNNILNKNIKFNCMDYELINFNETNFFLINRKKYSISKITPELFKVIDYFSKPRIITDIKQIIIENITIEENALKELFQLNILTPEPD